MKINDTIINNPIIKILIIAYFIPLIVCALIFVLLAMIYSMPALVLALIDDFINKDK